MTIANLRHMLHRADDVDRREGLLAYQRYHQVVAEFADYYGAPFDRALAAFCALSPNSDYFGNLRSLASVLQGVQRGVDPATITVSTYNHCRDRAVAYVTGDACFLGTSKGPKIRSFYYNILDPACARHVTVDGHMHCAYTGQNVTMKEAVVRRKADYARIANACKRLARAEGMLPNQVQATIWFARKRTQRIKYNSQLGLFSDPGDQWGTVVRVHEAPPYPHHATHGAQ